LFTNEQLRNGELKKLPRSRGEYFCSSKRKKDRHKLNFKTRHWVRFLNQENYLLTSLEEIFKRTLSGGCRFSYIALTISNKNLFFLKNRPTEPYYLEKQKDFLFSHLVWRQKAELDNLLAKHPYQFRKKWQEIKTQVEILSQWDNPSKLVPGYKENGRPKPSWEGKGWNSPTYWETKNRSLATLAFTHEIVLGKVGTETPLLDLDPNKKDKDGNYKIKQSWLRKDLSERGKKWKALINQHQIPYYWKTATPGNSLLPIPYWLIGSMESKKIYHQDTRQEIGDLLGQGDLVALPVGSDKSRQLVITKWGKQLVKKYGVEGILRKKLLDGDAEKEVERLLNTVFLTLDKSSVPIRPKSKLITSKYLTENEGDSPLKLKLQAKLLGKYKTPLDKIWKIFYLNQKSQAKGYFLVNDYQRERDFDNLNLGSIQNIYLVQGYKHQFLSRILPP
jgi:hypothetical protein